MAVIIHVDMDAFFASVEQRDNPSLRGRPVVVGGRSRRGVVAAASYEARPFGVRSAMPMVEALRRCPDVVVVPPNHDKYVAASEKVFEVFRRYTPEVQGLSLDEAFLDVTGSRALFGDGPTIARRIKAEVKAETDLIASAGVAPSKFVAKIASDQDKPDGLCVVREDEVVAFLRPLPIERMWGVGPKAATKLRGAGLSTLADLADAELPRLEALLGPSWGAHVQLLAQGHDHRRVVIGHTAKSIGHEHTFERDLRTRRELEAKLLYQASKVAARLVASDICGHVVQVKVKYGDHTLKTRQARLPEAVADTDSIYEAARELLGRFPSLERGVRLTGVSVSDLAPGPPQKGLFPEPKKAKREKIEQALAALKGRYGEKQVVRGTLLDQQEPHTSGDPQD